MGITTIKAIVRSLDNKNKKVEDKFLVDTGANYTVLPLNIVKKLGIKPVKKQEFSLADGTIIKRDMGYAMVEINGENAPTTVVLGEGQDSALIGVITLEGMGLMVHPFERRLVPMKLMLG